MTFRLESIAAVMLFAAVVLFAAPAFAQPPQVQWDEDYDFESVQTYQWAPTSETSLADVDPFMHSRIIKAIEFYLTEGGMTAVESEPDVYVTYHTETKTEVRLRSNHFGYGFADPYWGGYMGPQSTTTRVVEYEKGTLIVDIWDATQKELIWRGWVTRTIPSNPQRAEKDIIKAIDHLVKRWDALYRQSKR